jgi:hypothetical protein
MVKRIKFSDRLRGIIVESGIPRNQISKATKIDPAVLHRFINGSGISLPSIDALVKFFEIEISATRKGK